MLFSSLSYPESKPPAPVQFGRVPSVVSFVCWLLFYTEAFFLCPRTERSGPHPSVLSPSTAVGIVRAGGGGVPSVTVFQLLLLFYLPPCRRCSVSLQLFCRMNCSINRYKWVCSMEVSSGSSYVAILDWNLLYFLALTFRKVTNVFKKKPLYFLPIFLLCLCQVIHPFVGQS